MTDFTLTKDADGVATITWDVKAKSMNVLSLEGWDDLDACVTDALADEAVKGIVITSGKPDSFAGGMDLNVIAKMKAMSGEDPAQGLMDGLMKSHGILRRIERAGMDPKTNKGGKPVACVLPGTALGIGFEIPLACHRIFAADNPKAKIGLPEIMVGIFPGMGGTTRLAKKMGAMAASPFPLEGQLSDPNKAKAPRPADGGRGAVRRTRRRGGGGGGKRTGPRGRGRGGVCERGVSGGRVGGVAPAAPAVGRRGGRKAQRRR